MDSCVAGALFLMVAGVASVSSQCYKVCGSSWIDDVGHRSCGGGENACHVTLCQQTKCGDDYWVDWCGEDWGWECESAYYHQCS
jgi:hypothetical protein